MADVAEDDKDMEYGVDIWYLLEAVQHSSYDIGYALANNPQNYLQTATLDKGLKGDKNGKAHKYITGGLEVALTL